MPAEAASGLLSPTELLDVSRAWTAPRAKGVYAWWFELGSLPVPDQTYHLVDRFELLYVGIAPRKPSSSGRHSASRLRGRLVTHAAKSASRSTLRMSLGVLLASELDLELELRRDRARWGGEGEARLTRWLQEHARITWVEHDEPWGVESHLLGATPLPLNIQGRSDDFSRWLSAERSRALRAARSATGSLSASN